MAAKKSEDNHKITINPELARMSSAGVDVANVIALAGYVGVSPNEGVVRLHPSLGDLSISIDVSTTDILTSREAPASTMPLGGVVLWVARNAAVTFRRTRTVVAPALQTRGYFGAGPVLEPSNNNPVDRLNIRVRPTDDPVPPVYIPPEDCGVCTSPGECGSSQCETCQSRPPHPAE
jgi:hypothetical protein